MVLDLGPPVGMAPIRQTTPTHHHHAISSLRRILPAEEAAEVLGAAGAFGRANTADLANLAADIK
jgi:hypothetical protein